MSSLNEKTRMSTKCQVHFEAQPGRVHWRYARRAAAAATALLLCSIAAAARQPGAELSQEPALSSHGGPTGALTVIEHRGRGRRALAAGLELTSGATNAHLQFEFGEAGDDANGEHSGV